MIVTPKKVKIKKIKTSKSTYSAKKRFVNVIMKDPGELDGIQIKYSKKKNMKKAKKRYILHEKRNLLFSSQSLYYREWT